MILDNRQNGLVGDTFKKYLTHDTSISMVTNQFSIFAYHKLQKELKHIKDARLLFGSPTLKDISTASLLGNRHEIIERNQMRQIDIAKKMCPVDRVQGRCRRGKDFWYYIY